MNDVILGIVLGCMVLLIVIIVAWTVCAIAGRTDEEYERAWEEYCKEVTDDEEG